MQLYPHQQKSLDETSGRNRVAYYHDMGLGKTFTGSEKMMQLGTSMNILICQKSKVADWIEHFKTYYQVGVFDLTDTKQRQEFFGTIGKTIGVINYDLLFRRPIFKTLTGFTLMLDESSMIQNDTAKRSKFVLQMQPDNVILLSGTPTSGKYENLWTQIHLLGWNISKELYNKQYVNWKKIDFGGFPMRIVDKDEPYKNVERLKQKMREHGAVFLKTEECFELPEQVMIPIFVNTSKAYRMFQKTAVITLDLMNLVEFKDDSDFYGEDITPRVELVGDTVLTKRLYSRMLCGQYSTDKLQAFKDLASSTNDRLIVFYNFTDELVALKRIAEVLERPISEVNGQVKDLQNYEVEDNSITFIQYQAGAMGLNLQKANKMVFFTLTDKSELFEQAKKRIHRIGQNKTCFYYLMICRNSVEDQEILPTLGMRKEYTDELFR